MRINVIWTFTYMIFVSGGTFGILSSCCRKQRTVLCWQLHFSGHPIACAPFTKAVAATRSTKIVAAKWHIFTIFFLTPLFILFFPNLYISLMHFSAFLWSCDFFSSTWTFPWILYYNFQQIIFHISNVILRFTFMDSLILNWIFFAVEWHFWNMQDVLHCVSC